MQGDGIGGSRDVPCAAMRRSSTGIGGGDGVGTAVMDGKEVAAVNGRKAQTRIDRRRQNV